MAETVRIEIPIEVMNNTEPGVSEIIRGLQNLEKASKDAKTSVSDADATVSKFDTTSQQTKKSLRDMVNEKYELALEAVDRVAPVVSSATSAVKNIAGKAWSVTMKAVDLVTAPVRGIINLLKNPIFQVGAVLGVSIGLKDTIETFTEFEATMSQVKAISGATAEEFDLLNEKAKEMGATTAFTASEAGEAFSYMAMAGWEASDMLDGIEGIMSLAAASGEDLATVSDIVTDSLTGFGMAAEESGHFADVLATAATSANTTVSGMGETFKYVAPIAGTLGYSVEDVSVAVGLMANSAIKGSQAGTSLRQALSNMAAPTSEQEKLMKQLGIAMDDGKGNALEFSEVMDSMRTGFADLSDTEKTAAANTLFGSQAMSGMLAIINASDEEYDKLTESIQNADGAAEDMADTMLDNLQGAFTLLQSAVDGVKISLGERLKPYLQDFTVWLTNKMPDIEAAITSAMDTIDLKIAELKVKIKEFTGTSEWENADFFGKVKIAWDELIGNPFRQWWNGTGKEMIASVMSSIGQGIGTAISTGILALFGIDAGGVVDEGVSIGAAFSRGFADGFDGDAIKEAVMGAIKGIFSSAAGIFSGDASASNWLSAAIVGKTALSVGSTAVKGLSLGSTVLTGTSGTGGLLGLLGSSSAGTGLMGLGSNAAISLGAGNLAGGASLGAGALSGLGLGAIAGGVAAGASLISGGKDLYTGYTSEDENEASAYKKSGAKKVGGVAAGAAAGAAIGSVIPGIGTVVGGLIGAGIGGVTGWVSGKKDIEAYEEDLKEAEEAAAALAIAEAQARYESQELKDALADGVGENSKEFAEMLQKVVETDIASHFGDIKLSIEEIQTLAQKLVFGDSIDSINKFSEATAQAEADFASYQNAVSAMDKQNWKVGLGLELTESEMSSYQSSIDNLIESAKTYVESRHYEVTAAIGVFFEAEESEGLIENTNAMYATIQEQLDSLGKELTATVEIALEDGVITMDEQAEIMNLQQQINDITNKVAQAEQEASMEALKIKYGGAALDADSFAALQTELAAQVEAATESYDEALRVNISNLKLQLAEGIIDQSEYDAEFQRLADEYDAKIDEMEVSVESFQLDAIADAYADELENILPELEGTTADKLGEALHNAMENGVDATTWDLETASKWLGLESLEVETQTAIASLMGEVAKTIPEKLTSELEGSIDSTAFAPFSNEYIEAMQSAMLETEMDFNPFTSRVGTNLNTAWGDLMNEVDLSGTEELAATAETALDTSFIDVGTLSGSPVAANISDSIAANADDVQGGCDTVRTAADGYMTSAFANPFDVSSTVNITARYNLLNPNYEISGSGVQSSTGTLSIRGYATGGFVNGKQLSWVGEEGPEAIIPLVPGRRSSALDLWEKAGDILGVGKHAEGGIVGDVKYSHIPAFSDDTLNYITSYAKNLPRGNNESSEGLTEELNGYEYTPAVTTTEVGEGKDTEITVHVNVNPNFQISGNGNSDEDILNIIRSHMKEMADELGGEIAVSLEKVFSNMPLKEA